MDFLIQSFCKMPFRRFSVHIAGANKKSDTTLTGLETSEVSFVRLSSRSNLLIANKLTSDF